MSLWGSSGDQCRGSGGSEHFAAAPADAHTIGVGAAREQSAAGAATAESRRAEPSVCLALSKSNAHGAAAAAGTLGEPATAGPAAAYGEAPAAAAGPTSSLRRASFTGRSRPLGSAAGARTAKRAALTASASIDQERCGRSGGGGSPPRRPAPEHTDTQRGHSGRDCGERLLGDGVAARGTLSSGALRS